MSLVFDRPAAGAPAPAAPAPGQRPRRTRRTEALRAFVRETRLHPRQLVAPLFVTPGHGRREPVGSMPGVERVTPDEALRDARALEALGVGGLILFGLPADKDALGTGGWIRDGIVQETLRGLRDADLDLVLIADTCLCEYTDHGHCGPLLPDGRVDNDAAIELYARAAASQAEAGADIVAPSGMMDGQVAAIRRGLDGAGAEDTAILAYAARRRLRSTARSVTRPARRPRSAIGAATRWTRPTPASRCARWRSTWRRARTCC
jgi:porphobilinogen synthase